MRLDQDKIRERSISFDNYLADRLASDPEFREYWERTAFARALSIEVIRARTKLGLSQEELAQRMEAPIATVEQLEEGEDDPTLDTLRLLAERLGLRFNLTVTIDLPPGAETPSPALHARLDKTAA